ncbi:hypothetical protein KP509_30G026800 [Ceratopteris richardii]|uniref:Late embryogenesis abundant protein LEA-2 subgroup domain-containing protein n=1 Tax=Ceratopteris richardii TaxID=49495 RepID=A0A8T2R0Q6_CERRI|nr:hypothetical protein KP509_30G026800 [Ceratopteris richardii]
MDHKVHPMPPQPSAPPCHSRESSIATQSTISTFSIPMTDERALRQEQEMRFMRVDLDDSASMHHQQRPPHPMQKDFIYNVPAVLPPDHPSVIAARRSGRRCGGCCCCIATLCAILAIIVVMICIVALVVYLILQPKTPNFSVSNASVASFKLSSKPASASNIRPGATQNLNVDVTFNITGKNPNEKIGIDYADVKVILLYEDDQIGQGSIPPFYQGHKNTTSFLLHMMGKDVAMTPATGSRLQKTLDNAAGTILLNSQTMAAVRLKIGNWKSGASNFQINCIAEMTNPSAPNARVLSQSCSFKINKIRIL